MNRCPECWSAIDALATECPACDADLGPPPRRRPGLVVLASLGLAAAVVGWLVSGARPGPSITSTARPSVPPVDVADPAPTTAIHAARHHWRFGEWDAVALENRRGPLLVLPAHVLAHAGVPQEPEPPALEVVVFDLPPGIALVRPVGVDPRDLTPLAVSPGGLRPSIPLAAFAPDGSELHELELASRDPDGTVRLARSIPIGSVVVDGDGSAIGLAVSSRRVIPLDAVRPWLEQPAGFSRNEARETLRSRDPALVLVDAADLLAPTTPRLRDVRRAIDLIEHVQPMARDAATIDALGALLIAGHRALVQCLLQSDPSAAIAAARAAVTRFGSHPGLLEDACRVMLEHGDRLEAAGLFARLRSRSADAARSLADAVAAELVRTGNELLRQRRVADGLAHLERATFLLPRRADLHMALANGRSATGDAGGALEAARSAAQLDPVSHGDAVARLELAALPTRPGRAEVPIDPASGLARMDALIGDLPVGFVVDTGATMTTVPSSVAMRLGLSSPHNRRVQVDTAGGRVTGEVVMLPGIRLGGLELRRIEAVVLDGSGAMHGNGLLGMNALRRIRVQLDSGRGMLVLEERSPRGRR